MEETSSTEHVLSLSVGSLTSRHTKLGVEWRPKLDSGESDAPVTRTRRMSYAAKLESFGCRANKRNHSGR